MVRYSWKNGFKIWKENIKFLLIIIFVLAILEVGNYSLYTLPNQADNIFNYLENINNDNLLIELLFSLIRNAIILLIISKFNNLSLNKNIINKRIFVCLLIVTAVDNLSLIYKPISNKSIIVLLWVGVTFIQILLFMFPYLIIKHKHLSVNEGLKKSISYIRGNIFDYVLVNLSFLSFGAVLVCISIFKSIIFKNNSNSNFKIIFELILLVIIFYFVYTFYLSVCFAFAENIITKNESIENIDLEENEIDYEIENKTEEEKNDDKLFEELNEDIDNYHLEQTIRNQFENYEPLDYKEFIFKKSVTDFNEFDIIDFIMQTDLYMCLKENKKVKKYIKQVYSYVTIDILGYEKSNVTCNYSDSFKENNNNFMVEVIINKQYSNYDITIILTINGETLF